MAGYIAERVLEGEAAREGSSIDERVAALMLTTWAGCRSESEAGASPGAEPAAELLCETEQAVGEAIARNESQARAIAPAVIRITPFKLQGGSIQALIKGIR